MNCTLGGYGAGRVVGMVHEGQRFDVLAVESEGRRLALKVPAPPRARREEGATTLHAVRELGGVSTTWNVICEAGTTNAGDLLARHEIEVTPEDLLLDELRRLGEAAPHWNHSALGLFRCELGARGEVPGLLMPWHPGPTLAAFPRRERRRLLPRMMPSLWDALAAGLHGDMHGSNLIIAPAEDRFSLIDPGALVLHHLPKYMASSGSDVLTFISNAEMYPVLPPYAITMPLSAGGGLRDHWESFVRSMTLSDLARPLQVTEHVILHAVSAAAGRFLMQLPRPRGEPHASDLLAAGLLYYQALTGTHPLYDAVFTKPAWVELSCVDDRMHGAKRGSERLSRGITAPSRLDPSVQPAEDALAMALLDLRVPDRDRLQELSAAAALAADAWCAH